MTDTEYWTMVEAEYLAGTDPAPMLSYARAQMTRRKLSLTARKLRLFAVACCRLIWHLLDDPRSRLAVETAEQYADGRVLYDDLAVAETAARDAARDVAHAAAVLRTKDSTGEATREAAWEAAWAAAQIAAEASACDDMTGAAWNASWNVSEAAAQAAVGAAPSGGDPSAARLAARAANRGTQAALLRCVLGNPWRPAPRTFARWDGIDLGPTVRALARSIYDTRDWGALPILADALEEAGCTEESILAHLRNSGPHCRGDWCVDLILGLA